MKYAISYLLGGLVLFPLLLYGVNILFFSPREVTHQQVEQYMNDLFLLQDIPNNEKLSFEEESNDKYLSFRIKTITHFLDRRGKGNQEYNTYTYFSSKYGKYIQLIVIIEGVVIEWAVKKELEMTVNKSQWEDPNYGTKENPIPVLKFVGVNRSLRRNNLDYDKQYMDKVYHETVKTYLTYLMPKSEFKQKFMKD